LFYWNCHSVRIVALDSNAVLSLPKRSFSIQLICLLLLLKEHSRSMEVKHWHQDKSELFKVFACIVDYSKISILYVICICYVLLFTLIIFSSQFSQHYYADVVRELLATISSWSHLCVLLSYFKNIWWSFTWHV